MQSKNIIPSKSAAPKLFSLQEIKKMEGVFRPVGYEKDRVISLLDSYGKSILLFVDPNSFEPLETPAWDTSKFEEVDESVSLTFSNKK